MSRLLHIVLCVLLSFRLVVADPASTFLRSSKSKSSSLGKSLLSAHLVRRGNFIAQGEWCPSGYALCCNSNRCAPIGHYCCSDIYYSCPYDTTCFGSSCCPNTAQTCNGKTCCDSGSSCCSDNTCCDSGSSCCNDNTCCEFGTFCCNDSSGGCCPTGSTCVPNTDMCSSGGGSGGSSATPTMTPPPPPSKPTGTTNNCSSVVIFNTVNTSSSVPISNSVTTFSGSIAIIFNGPSSSTLNLASSTVLSGGSA
ncbi:hypothetical protein EDD22DRAFT_401887 [Suillus occidentalis]|nr:hypothetical protein EDD22DRAFT_401887 [Suillus occidentalis]